MITDIDICAMQETHLIEKKQTQLIKRIATQGILYTNNHTSKSAGVSLFIATHLHDKILEKTITDNNGRLLIKKTTIINKSNQHTWIGTVYLPHEPTQRKNYILNTLNPLIQTIPETDNIILMGDFNIISNPHLDHIGGQITSGRTGNTELNEITTHYSLIDTWRHLHPDQRGFTRSNAPYSDTLLPKRTLQTNVKTRIDKI